MRIYKPDMRAAAVAVAACCAFNSVYAASHEPLSPDEADQLPGTGWQLLSTAPATSSIPASKQLSAPVKSSAAVPPSSPKVVVSPVPTQPVQQFSLIAGKSIESQIESWAKVAGWSVTWNAGNWIVPHATSFPGDFVDAAGAVIKALAANGANIQATFYQGNNMMVVTGGGSNE